ncbi:MAG TPA: formyltransferase family protein, partial [Anaeromyxobacteraceae bacterium]|nr:formyltransferase family protein [Anaeromyxobacteraceae bacterium]
ARINDPEIVARLEAVRMDHLLVLGWSQLIGEAVMRTAHKGAIGLHPAPLPELRGRAVIPWTILTRRTRTATSLFWIDEGPDSGDLLAQRFFDVAPDETARSLYDKHLRALEAMLPEVLHTLATGTAPRIPQDHARATWCAKRTAQDGELDWQRPAEELWTLIRAVGRPYPGAFTRTPAGQKLTIWTADLVERAPHIALPGQIVELANPPSAPHRPDPLSPRAKEQLGGMDAGGEGQGEGGRSTARAEPRLLIACREGFLRATTWTLDPATPPLKLHDRLGRTP